ncbi:Cyclin [Geosmithia morbida]|uniref:Cyclin n=1 Tax=Geosmithia morbida TaxID=1094350 RepID=A0A9P4YPE1_9HYPO|nr:Cyclin [Geosmithia morbida]KAF4119377.1 Cyclin [Geosmithia morbida]
MQQQPTIHLEQDSKTEGIQAPKEADGKDREHHDLSRLPASEALRLVSASLERLVRITGDVPPTPPPRTPTDPQMSGLLAEKDFMARYSPSRTPPAGGGGPSIGSDSTTTTSTTSAGDAAAGTAATTTPPSPAPATTRDDGNKLRAYRAAVAQQMQLTQQQAIDGVRLKTVPKSPAAPAPPSSQPSSMTTPPDASAPGEDDMPNAPQQHGAITRKFYSKLEPPISITSYMARLHQFCPASAAVYLAASVYIHRLAVEQAAIPVTRRNVHRLALAGVRVAAKALEDLAYPHAKVARVGGVSESELARLEVSFCFLAGFDLVVGEELLNTRWMALRRDDEADADVPLLKLGRPGKQQL